MNLFLQPCVTASRIMAERKFRRRKMQLLKQFSSKTKTSAKLEDLTVLEGKLSAQIDAFERETRSTSWFFANVGQFSKL